MIERVHVYVSGRVQGVFYRQSTAEKAESIGVNGWVRNLPDGRVEAVFEADSAKVNKMLAWCRQGPPSARVQDVKIIREETPEGLKGFTLKG